MMFLYNLFFKYEIGILIKALVHMFERNQYKHFQDEFMTVLMYQILEKI